MPRCEIQDRGDFSRAAGNAVGQGRRGKNVLHVYRAIQALSGDGAFCGMGLETLKPSLGKKDADILVS